jgi:hypothetical protein
MGEVWLFLGNGPTILKGNEWTVGRKSHLKKVESKKYRENGGNR